MSRAPNVRKCECVASDKFRRLSGSSSCGIGPSASQVMSSTGGGASDVTGVSGLKNFGEDKSTMFKTYFGSLPINCVGLNFL